MFFTSMRRVIVSLPQGFLKNKRSILRYILGSLCVFLLQIQSHGGTNLPLITFSALSFCVSFLVSAFLIKTKSLLENKQLFVWQPFSDIRRAWKMSLLCFLMGIHIITEQLGKNYTLNVDPLSEYSLDVWNAQIPFWVATFGGFLNTEKLIITGGTSLALTCSMILMLPFSAFSAGVLSNALTMFHVLAFSGALVLGHHLLSDRELCDDGKLRPLCLVMNISIFTPLFMFFPAALIEFTRVSDYIQTMTLLDITYHILLHGGFVFLMTYIFLENLTTNHLLVIATIYCSGASINLWKVCPATSFFGLCMIMATITTHSFFLWNEKSNTEYEILNVQENSR